MFGMGPQELVVIPLMGCMALPTVFALVDCLKSHPANVAVATPWVLAIVLAPLIGPILWYTVGRRQAANA